MKRNQIGWYKALGLALALMLTLFIAACGGTAAEEPAAAPVEEQSSVAQAPAEEADDHSEDEEHEEESENREHGPHEHGAATLTVAWSGSEMVIELDTPAFNLFGFEYEPVTSEEIQHVEESLADLESGALMVLNDEAGCRLNEAEATTAWDKESDHGEGEEGDHNDGNEGDHDEGEEGDHDEGEEGETHSDVVARLRLTCDAPDEIRMLDLGPLFERFPNLENLDAQWVSEDTQSSAELSAGSSVLSLR